MTKQELYEEMKQLFQEFDRAHNSSKKKDAAAARKAAGALKKLVTPYNQASVAEAKAAKGE
jgi:ABC-type Na+ efflux pump permease subunit